MDGTGSAHHPQPAELYRPLCSGGRTAAGATSLQCKRRTCWSVDIRFFHHLHVRRAADWLAWRSLSPQAAHYYWRPGVELAHAFYRIGAYFWRTLLAARAGRHWRSEFLYLRTRSVIGLLAGRTAQQNSDHFLPLIAGRRSSWIHHRRHARAAVWMAHAFLCLCRAGVAGGSAGLGFHAGTGARRV